MLHTQQICKWTNANRFQFNIQFSCYRGALHWDLFVLINTNISHFNIQLRCLATLGSVGIHPFILLLGLKHLVSNLFTQLHANCIPVFTASKVWIISSKLPIQMWTKCHFWLYELRSFCSNRFSSSLPADKELKKFQSLEWKTFTHSKQVWCRGMNLVHAC